MISLLISIIPLQFLKNFLFNMLGHSIKNSKIGFFVILKSKSTDIENAEIKSFNIINAEKIFIKNSKISYLNHFKNIRLIEIIDTKIGKLNKFTADLKHKIKDNSLNLDETYISHSNLFDLTSSIKISKSMIKSNCQFWTHEFNFLRKIKLGSIEIKKNVTINNFVIILPSITIESEISISSASVVHKSLAEKGEYKSMLISK